MPPFRERAWPRRIVTAVCIPALSLVLIEAGLRCLPIGPRVYEPRRYEPHGGVPFTQLTSGSISFPAYQPNTTFWSVYDPAGDERKYLEAGGKVKYRINSAGFRGSEIPIARSAGCLRVVCLGDSLTFGEGVHEEDAYPARLEKILRARMPGRTVQVINAGVQAYGTREEVSLFLLRGLPFKPDVVTLGFFLNDVVPFEETIRQNEAAMKAPPMSAAARVSRIREIFERRELARERQAQLERSIRRGFQSEDWEICKGLLRTMQDQSRASGFRFIVLILPVLWGLDGAYPFEDIHREIAAACGQIGCECVDMLDVLRGRRAESLWVHPTDQHPNEIAHRLIAERLVAMIEQGS